MTAKSTANVNREDFQRLLALNFAVVEALHVEGPQNQRSVDAEILSQKLFRHAVTAYALSEGTRTHIDGINGEVAFVDWPSVYVLARACMEAYLVFWYIFVEPANENESEFRYRAWVLSGATRRQSFPALTDEAKNQLVRDKRAIESMCTYIQNNTFFHQLSTKNQRAVLEGGNWHPGISLSKIAEVAIGRQWGASIYSFLCEHVHAGGLSAAQFRQTASDEENLQMVDGALAIIAIVLALMTERAAEKFPKVAKVLGESPDRALNWACAKQLEATLTDAR